MILDWSALSSLMALASCMVMLGLWGMLYLEEHILQLVGMFHRGASLPPTSTLTTHNQSLAQFPPQW